MKTSRALNEESGRRSLPHDPPHFIASSDDLFFITICCQARRINQLCLPDTAGAIFAAARHYYDMQYWSIPLLLVMPDHLHMLVSFSGNVAMTKTVRNWKRYVAAQHKIQWQRDFFD